MNNNYCCGEEAEGLVSQALGVTVYTVRASAVLSFSFFLGGRRLGKFVNKVIIPFQCSSVYCNTRVKVKFFLTDFLCEI